MTIKGKNVADLKKSAKKSLRGKHHFAGTYETVALVAVEDPEARSFLAQGLSALGVDAVLLNTPEKKPVGKRKKKPSDAQKTSPEEAENAIATDSVSQDELSAFDFVIWDDRHRGLDLVAAVSAGVVPVLPQENTFSSSFSQFNPMEYEGNAFLFADNNPFLMFAAVVAYLENSKFPEDKRLLLKNVVKTF